MKHASFDRLKVARAICLLLSTWLAVPAASQESADATQPAAHAEIGKVLASGSLKTQPNPVVLEFLEAVGSERLTPEQLERARKQTVDGLRERTEISQMAAMAAMTSAMPKMMKSAIKEQFKPKNMLRARLGVGGGNAAMQSEMMETFSSAMVAPWVRGLAAARALRDAGYEREAAAFYRRCLAEPTMASGADEFLSASAQRVRGGCLDDLIALGPDTAAPILGELADFEAADESQAGAAAAAQAAGFSGLAALIEGGAFNDAQRAAVVEAALYVVDRPKKQLADASAAAAIEVLAVTTDARVETLLGELADSEKKLPLASAAARTALARGYRDPASLDWLRSRMEDGSWQAFEVLIAMDHDAAWNWAGRQLRRGSVPQDETDWRPALLELFAGATDERSREMLLGADDPEAAPGNYIQALVDTALFQRGERDRIESLGSALEQSEWDLGRGSLGRKWQLVKPLVKAGAAAAIGLPMGFGGAQSNQEAVANLAFGAADLKAENESAQEAAARQLRFRIAAALAGWNDASTLPLIEKLLDSPDLPTRIAGARALLGQTAPDAAPLVKRAVLTDYDPAAEEAGVAAGLLPADLPETDPQDDPATPEIQAALMMHADYAFPDAPEFASVLQDPAAFGYPTVRFIAAGLVEMDGG